jgi:hypothetical protein
MWAKKNGQLTRIELPSLARKVPPMGYRHQ